MQPVIHLRAGRTLLIRQPPHHGLLPGRHGQAIETARIDHDAIADERLGQGRLRRFARRRDDAHDGEVEGARELEVALVVPGHGHDGARAIVHEHVVRHPDGYGGSIHRVGGVAAKKDAGLLLVILLALHQIPRRDFRQIRRHRLALRRRGEALDRWMLRRKHQVSGAEQGIWAGGEDLNGLTFGHEVHLGAQAAADPIGLRFLGDCRPIDAVQVVQEPLGVLGDLEEPLRQAALCHGRFATFTKPLQHLLVGQHRVAGGTPVHRRLPTLHQTAVEELEEHPLRPAVIRWMRGVDHMVPVIHAAEALQHAREVGDVLWDEVVRIAAHLQRVVLRMDAEGVKADGLKHILAVQPPIAPVHVGARVGIEIADVQPLRGRVGEHHQVVVRVLRDAQGRVGKEIGAALVPSSLPFALHGERVVAVCGGHGAVGAWATPAMLADWSRGSGGDDGTTGDEVAAMAHNE